MTKVNLTFEMPLNSQAITLQELNDFETLIGHTLPEDYRQHMLTYNGGLVEQDNNAHINYPEAGSGIAKFFPIKYGNYTMEKAYATMGNFDIPNGYFIIGKTWAGGDVILSLNDDSTYGNTKEWYPDGTLNDLSPSFTQLINDQVEQQE